MAGEGALPPLALANSFIERHGGSQGIHHMKLQKLCYYAHGWWLSHHPDPFLSERPEVWRHGPVFRGLYRALANFGSLPVPRPQKLNPFGETPFVWDEDQIALLDWIWDRYGQYGAFTLSDMTHAPGTPWQQIAEKYDYQVPKGLELPDDIVAAYFKKQAAELASA